MLEEISRSLSLWLPGVSIMFALTFASGFFSGSETAMFSLTRDDLQTFRSGSASEKNVVQLLGDPSRLLTAILFWNLVVNLSYFAVSVVVSRRLILSGYDSAGWLFSLLGVVSIILFGEVIPKSVSVVFPRPISRLIVWPLLVSTRALDRMLPVLTMMTRGLQRGFWPHLAEESLIDAEDLEKAVDLSTQSSEMIAHERSILHHILDLSEIAIEEVMRPRGTYVTVTEPTIWKDLGFGTPPGGFAAIVESGTDQVVGVYWMHGTIYHQAKGLDSFRESVVYVPWCAHAARTLSQMRSSLCHVAVVVDEYGQTIGVATQQDLLDTIFTPVPSRARRILQREAILKIGDDKYHLDGLTTLRFLSVHLNIPFDADEEPSVTVAGLLHQHFRRFPEINDEMVWQGWKLRVFDVPGPGRARVLLEPAEQPEQAATEASS